MGSVSGSDVPSGNGGLFGWWGVFRAPALGEVSVYATTLEGRAVVLRASDGRMYVLTPADPDALARALTAAP